MSVSEGPKVEEHDEQGAPFLFCSVLYLGIPDFIVLTYCGWAGYKLAAGLSQWSYYSLCNWSTAMQICIILRGSNSASGNTRRLLRRRRLFAFRAIWCILEFLNGNQQDINHFRGHLF